MKTQIFVLVLVVLLVEGRGMGKKRRVVPNSQRGGCGKHELEVPNTNGTGTHCVVDDPEKCQKTEDWVDCTPLVDPCQKSSWTCPEAAQCLIDPCNPCKRHLYSEDWIEVCKKAEEQ